jgi:hypothetical protein
MNATELKHFLLAMAQINQLATNSCRNVNVFFWEQEEILQLSVKKRVKDEKHSAHGLPAISTSTAGFLVPWKFNGFISVPPHILRLSGVEGLPQVVRGAANWPLSTERNVKKNGHCLQFCFLKKVHCSIKFPFHCIRFRAIFDILRYFVLVLQCFANCFGDKIK